MDKIIHHVRRVRSQPEEVRQSILHALTIVSGVILFFLWVFSLGSSASDTTAQSFQEDIAPFSALKANLIEGYNSISIPAEFEAQLDPGLELDPNY
jgi:hypothetical protein